MKRILCLWFPNWSMQRLDKSLQTADVPSAESRKSDHPRRRVLVQTTTLPGRGDVVACCNPMAWQRGIRPGMPVAEARSWLRSQDVAHLEPLQPALDRQAMCRIAEQCERFSPCVALDESEPLESLLIDLSGVTHLFGGEHGLVKQVQELLQPAGWHVHLAIANTVGQAWATARFAARLGHPWIQSADRDELAAPLPLEGLRLPSQLLQRLRRLGLQTIPQVLQLPRSALPARFGTEICERLDQFTGQREELLTPYRPPVRYRVERKLDDALTQSAAIEQLWLSQLEKLLARLAPRQLGMRGLHGALLLETAAAHPLPLRFCQALADRDQIAELVRLKLEASPYPAPVIGVRWEAVDVAPLGWSQQTLFAGQLTSQTRELAALLNRLASRLGSDSVTTPQRMPCPLPERSVVCRPVVDVRRNGVAVGPQAATPVSSWLPLDRPTRLWPQPRPITVIARLPIGCPARFVCDQWRVDVVQHWGPERIESHWWEGPMIRRDYYHVETSRGERLWIFCDLTSHNWYWHGDLC